MEKIDLKSATLEDLTGNYILVKEPLSSADVYDDAGAGPILFAIDADNFVRALSPKDVQTGKYTTAGEKVISWDTSAKTIKYVLKNDLNYSYELGSVVTDKYYGNIAVALLQAISLYLGSISPVTYDYNLLSAQELADLVVSSTDTPKVPTVGKVTTTATTATIPLN